MEGNISVIVPYYNQPLMLHQHMATWLDYPREVRDCLQLMVVDDGSQVSPALPVVEEYLHRFIYLGNPPQLYRIKQDIPWNRGGARNLGSRVATSAWLMHMDIDHVLPAGFALTLIDTKLNPNNMYRFHRFRHGKADATRKKDALAEDAEFGPIKPHGDSYLVTRKKYWEVGGYDEDYSGILGGGSPFLAQLEQVAPPKMLPDDILLYVYTESTCADASVKGLSRDTTAYSKLRRTKELANNVRARNPIRFDWERQL